MEMMAVDPVARVIAPRFWAGVISMPLLAVDGTMRRRLKTDNVAGQAHIWYESCPVCHGTYFDAGEFRDYKSETFFDRVKALFTPERR